MDLRLTMPQAYTPIKKPDDYRCFVVDWPKTKPTYVSGFQVIPGDPKMVHHIIAYLAAPNQVAYYKNKDAREKGPGYTCYGTAGGGAAWLGVWAPGVKGTDYPKGTGIKVLPGSKIIIQVHYNTLTNKPASDKSSVEFKLDDTVQNEAILLPYLNPAWLYKPKNCPSQLKAFGYNCDMVIPPNNPNYKVRFEVGLGLLSLLSKQFLKKEFETLTVHNVMLHMHWRGKAGRVFIKKGGKEQCLLNIPRWDFNWQMSYELKKPVTLGLSDSIGLACSWDNSAANQPVINGKKEKPITIYWGDGTNDEMCLGLAYVTCKNKGKAVLCPNPLAAFGR